MPIKKIPAKKENRGGGRKGAGRKLEYGEATETIAFRVPQSKVDIIKKIIKDK